MWYTSQASSFFCLHPSAGPLSQNLKSLHYLQGAPTHQRHLFGLLTLSSSHSVLIVAPLPLSYFPNISHLGIYAFVVYSVWRTQIPDTCMPPFLNLFVVITGHFSHVTLSKRLSLSDQSL